MNRMSLFAIVALFAAPSIAFAQGGPSPLAAPVGHRQPTASGLAPAASSDALGPVQSGRSVSRTNSLDNLDDISARDQENGPRICTNCDD